MSGRGGEGSKDRFTFLGFPGAELGVGCLNVQVCALMDPPPDLRTISPQAVCNLSQANGGSGLGSPAGALAGKAQ